MSLHLISPPIVRLLVPGWLFWISPVLIYVASSSLSSNATVVVESQAHARRRIDGMRAVNHYSVLPGRKPPVALKKKKNKDCGAHFPWSRWWNIFSAFLPPLSTQIITGCLRLVFSTPNGPSSGSFERHVSVQSSRRQCLRSFSFMMIVLTNGAIMTLRRCTGHTITV